VGAEEKRFIENAHEGEDINAVSFGSDGLRLLSASDRSLRLWNLNTDPPTLLREFPKAQDTLMWASLSRDDQRVAGVGRDQLVNIYAALDGQVQHGLVGHENAVFKAIFSPDSQQVATVSGDATVRVWDLSNGKELFCLRLPMNQQDDLWDFDFRITPRGKCLIAVPLTRGKLVVYELGYGE